MIPDALLDQTAARFPRYLRESIRIEPLEKGGSDRKYYRIALCGEGSLILVKYGNQREENRHYCDIAAFLSALDVRVPAIYHHDSKEGLIWMEDLGGSDLWQFRESPWETRRPLYRSALEQVVRLHTRGHRATATPPPRFELAFDAELYRWEQRYFFENCAGRYFGIPPATLDAGCGREPLDAIAERLDALPRVLVHRDFQSQNIMILGGQACLIDFQGMRPGLAAYDLASLLYDPYVTLTAAERNELLAIAERLYAEAGAPVEPGFREIFDLCALQRLMQALGAYGFLGLVKAHPHFLAHIPPALASLREVAARIPGLEAFRTLLERLPTAKH
ncbi:MAG: phosphotransferase [Chthoniobacteraceae bacterium]|nr:phosphotransferase [Chthoniobacteraceae bacterium]